MSRLVQFADAKMVLELGTSLGISAAYLASASSSVKVVTVEGDPAISESAEELFKDLELKNVELINDSFENFLTHDHLPSTIDVAFIDGNHRQAALLDYYEKIKPGIGKHSILIIDDIYWSADMEEAWKKLISKNEVTQSVDCFHFGLLFFSDDFLQKENHIIRLPMRAMLKT